MAAGRCTFVIGHASKPEMHKSACWQIGNYNSADNDSISGGKPQLKEASSAEEARRFYADRS